MGPPWAAPGSARRVLVDHVQASGGQVSTESLATKYLTTPWLKPAVGTLQHSLDGSEIIFVPHQCGQCAQMRLVATETRTSGTDNAEPKQQPHRSHPATFPYVKSSRRNDARTHAKFIASHIRSAEMLFGHFTLGDVAIKKTDADRTETSGRYLSALHLLAGAPKSSGPSIAPGD